MRLQELDAMKVFKKHPLYKKLSKLTDEETKLLVERDEINKKLHKNQIEINKMLDLM